MAIKGQLNVKQRNGNVRSRSQILFSVHLFSAYKTPNGERLKLMNENQFSKKFSVRFFLEKWRIIIDASILEIFSYDKIIKFIFLLIMFQVRKILV